MAKSSELNSGGVNCEDSNHLTNISVTVDGDQLCVDNCPMCIPNSTTRLDIDMCLPVDSPCIDNCPDCNVRSTRLHTDPMGVGEFHGDDAKGNVINDLSYDNNCITLDEESLNFVDFEDECILFEDGNLSGPEIGEVNGKFNPYKGYIPTQFVPDLEHFPEFISNVHSVGGCPSQMNASAWMYELQFENDAWLKSYLLQGITNGFDIVDDYDEISPYDRSNYRSVESGPAANFVHDLIMKEIRETKYIYSNVRPKCVHF